MVDRRGQAEVFATMFALIITAIVFGVLIMVLSQVEENGFRNVQSLNQSVALTRDTNATFPCMKMTSYTGVSNSSTGYGTINASRILVRENDWGQLEYISVRRDDAGTANGTYYLHYTCLAPSSASESINRTLYATDDVMDYIPVLIVVIIMSAVVTILLSGGFGRLMGGDRR